MLYVYMYVYTHVYIYIYRFPKTAKTTGILCSVHHLMKRPSQHLQALFTFNLLCTHQRALKSKMYSNMLSRAPACARE